jgi:hypothetical protein
VKAEGLKRETKALKKASKARKIEEKKLGKASVNQATGGWVNASGGEISTSAKLRATRRIVSKAVIKR